MAGLLRRRRRQLDDYEPRTTLMLRRHARRTGNQQLLAALDDPDFRRAANAEVVALAEEEEVDVDSDRPFRDWLLGLLDALKPLLIKLITSLLESWMGGVPGMAPVSDPMPAAAPKRPSRSRSTKRKR